MPKILTTVTNDLGIRLTLEADSPEQALTLIRQMSAKGYVPDREERPGGIELPLDAHDNFDWSLIGARPWKSPDGDEGVFHKGYFYRRRNLEAVDSRKMKLPEAIKYSRGAKPTDPLHIQEKGEGDICYVSLIIFRGKGLVRPEYQKQGAAPRPATAPATPRPAAPARPVPAPRPNVTLTPQPHHTDPPF